MLRLAMKAVNRWRRIYHLKRHGKQISAQSQTEDVKAYDSAPTTAAVVQLFNKKQNIEAIVGALKNSAFDEIIVLDDGSSDGAIEILPRLLQGKNHFVIRSNDLFEVRTYARALEFTRGEIVALLQDDDLPPADSTWVQSAVELFRLHPRLAVLGGRDGLELKTKQGPNGTEVTYSAINHRGGERVEIPFTFVDVVNRAPMLVRKSAITAIGGIDQIFAPFQCDDVDLCLRAWKAGYQVGVFATGFVRDVGMGGMRLYNVERTSVQASKNWKIIHERYAEDIETGVFRDLVNRAKLSQTAR